MDRYSQMTIDGLGPDISEWGITHFSADGFFKEAARQAIEKKYITLTDVPDRFSRQSVSYQLSKKDCLHRWLKYKEGFSSNLVEELMQEMHIKPGEMVLDPFMGSGTTALVCQMHGVNSMGYDVMPMSALAIKAKSAIYRFNLPELKELCNFIASNKRPVNYQRRVDYICITYSAYPEATEMDIKFYTDLIEHSSFSDDAKSLAKLCMTNSLERLSYTSKDGQYLRWDWHSKKVIEANKKRVEKGQMPLPQKLDKGVLPCTQDLLLSELQQAIEDIREIQNEKKQPPRATIDFYQGSALLLLPKVEDDFINGVITSPPYCNRYDYTRIYALELVYLGMNEDSVRNLRQELLSCTVENKPKLEYLKEYYVSLGKSSDYDKIIGIINNNEALMEVFAALDARSKNGDINNKGVLQMVRGYFEELTFIYYELFRVCKPGARVAFVNDNVRYAGEVIPVDFISNQIAEQCGFNVVCTHTLRQQKGNSSQQMKKYGRVALRKSITVWSKPQP